MSETTNTKNRTTLLDAIRPIGRAVFSTKVPVLAHLTVTRKCNLSCAYCNEYDKVSPPVPFEELNKRIQLLADMKTAIITCTGGEPLLHPDFDDIVRSIRRAGMCATLITNGYLLTERRIKQLNEAGLQELQISIDNIEPDDVSMKSLKVLDKKLDLLAKHAEFKVNINSVLGVSDKRTADAIAVAKKATYHQFSHSVGLLHDGSGAMKGLSEKQLAAYHEIGRISKSVVHKFNYRLFQKNLIEGRPNKWQCRAGARYLYICEDGLVHWCSQQRGYPGIPLEEYTAEMRAKEFNTKKPCAPFCTVGCVHQASMFDRFRSKQKNLPQKKTEPDLKTVAEG